jgi:flagellar biosynthesis protein FlhG
VARGHWVMDQADKLRLLVGQATPEAAERIGGDVPLIVVTGARASVGATTVSLNLAAVLADCGERVLLLDGSQRRGESGDSILPRREVEHGLAEVLSGKCRLADAIVAGPGGMRMLLQRGTSRTSQDLSRQAHQKFIAELQSLNEQFDAIVVDAGRGLTPWSQAFWSRGRLIALVTTPDDDAVLDAYSIIKQSIADGDQLPVRLLVNQADSDAAADRAHRRIDNSCRRFLSRSVAALPALVRLETEMRTGNRAPRVWEIPNSRFGHGVLWLGRTVEELLATKSRAKPNDGDEREREFQWRVSA